MTPGYNFQKIRCAIIHDIGLGLFFCPFIGLLVAVGFGFGGAGVAADIVG